MSVLLTIAALWIVLPALFFALRYYVRRPSLPTVPMHPMPSGSITDREVRL